MSRPRRQESVIRYAALILLTAFALTFTATARSSPWPVTPAARHFRFPAGWLLHSGVFCLHRHESVDWHRGYVDWQGRPSSYSGGLQFLASTWHSAGGTGDAYQWSIREQVYRAFLVWRHDGDWSEWGTAGACHV